MSCEVRLEVTWCTIDNMIYMISCSLVFVIMKVISIFCELASSSIIVLVIASRQSAIAACGYMPFVVALIRYRLSMSHH